MKRSSKLFLFACLTISIFTLLMISCGNKEGTDSSLILEQQNSSKLPNPEPQKTEPHVHSYTEWNLIKEATCTEDGNGEYLCSCGEKQAQTVKATGHLSAVIAAKSPSCTEAGLSEWEKCSVCDETLVEATVIPSLGHTIAWDPAVPATCTDKGLSIGSHCTVCNTVLRPQTVTNMLSHTVVYDKKIDATCTQTGLTQGSHCSVCDTVITAQEIINQRKHSYKRTVVNPTCTSQGYTLYECQYSDCEHFYMDTYKDPIAHSINSNGICTSCDDDFSVNIQERLGNLNLSWTNKTHHIYDYDYVVSTFSAKNASGKQISYVTVYLQYINQVNDVVYSESSRITGPFFTDGSISTTINSDTLKFSWMTQVSGAGHIITDVEVTHVKLEYSDGTYEICK